MEVENLQETAKANIVDDKILTEKDMILFS